MTHRTTCHARQVNDQMLCPCGLQWDVNDPNPPKCHGGQQAKRRTQYLGFIGRMFGVKGKKV